MKIFIAAYQPERIGGGWTFARNFAQGMVDEITSYEEADIYFIPSPSMVSREEVRQAKDDGKRIVLRLDNAVRNSRNRNTGMTRMKDFADWADLIIFQSQWAADYLSPFLNIQMAYTNKKVAIILNGVDGADYSYNAGVDHNNHILYSRFNRDETKNWEVARYWFSQYQLENPSAMLHIVGQFSQELIDGNFDFYNNEHYQFYGVLDRQNMIRLYSTCNLLYTYYNDACSNTLIEALMSNAGIVGDEYYLQTGGAYEILEAFRDHGRKYFGLGRMIKEYKEAINAIN